MAVATTERRFTRGRIPSPISKRGELSTIIPIKKSPVEKLTTIEMLGRNPDLTEKERFKETILELNRSDPNFSKTFFKEDKTLTEPQQKEK